MKCPNCNVDLVMSERSGIEIDYCPQCRGVWLDRGELDKIIERNNKEDISTPPPPKGDLFRERDYRERDDRDDDYYKHKRHKKGGLLGDLFDF